MKNVALLVHACDRYQLLYQGFDHFFAENWDFAVDCQRYFATEVLDIEIPNFKNIKSGRGEWSDRLAFLLKNEIKEDYVLYFQEDMWLNKPVQANFFNKLFDLTIKNDWKQVKLHSSEVYKTRKIDHFIDGFNLAEVDNQGSRYLMSHQITLWNRQYLIDQLPKNEHPWRHERRGTKRLKKLNPLIMHVDYFAENGKPPINQNQKMIGRSEYQTISMNGMLNQNVAPFVDILLKSGEIAQNYGQKLQFHLQNNLTHDGKPKPRKEDFFKKIMTWLKIK